MVSKVRHHRVSWYDYSEVVAFTIKRNGGKKLALRFCDAVFENGKLSTEKVVHFKETNYIVHHPQVSPDRGRLLQSL